jgi:hypothetical protein
MNKAHDFNPLAYPFQGKRAKWFSATKALERIHSGQSADFKHQISLLCSLGMHKQLFIQ